MQKSMFQLKNEKTDYYIISKVTEEKANCIAGANSASPHYTKIKNSFRIFF